MRAKILTVEEIDRQFTGSDIQEKIKRQIQSLYLHNNLKYVLLGGDDSVVPVRTCYCKASDRLGSIPADNYYVCFNGNFKWDANNNGIYGEIDDEVDFSSTVFISRLPVRNSQHVTDYYSNMVFYELNQAGKSVHNRNILMCGVNLFDSRRVVVK